MAKGPNAALSGSVAGFMLTSACGGTILLGSNDRDVSAVDGASVPASPSPDSGIGADAAQPGAVTVLVTGQFSPTSIAIDATNLYWVNEGMPGQLDAVPCTTCTSDTDCASTCGPVQQPNTRWCCAKSSGQCVTQNDACSNPGSSSTTTPFGPVQIMKCAKSGCNNSPTVLVSDVTDWGDGGRMRGLAVDDTNVYWTSGTAVFACAIAGCNNAPTIVHNVVGTEFMSGWPGIAPEISAIHQTVYTGDMGTVYSDSVGVGRAKALFSRGISWMWVAVDGTNAYVGSLEPAPTPSVYIGSCALGGCGGAPTMLASSPVLSASSGPIELAGQLVVDDANVYWGQQDGPTAFLAGANGYIANCGLGGLLFKCAKTGCNNNASTLLSGLHCPIGMATDGANVYFSEPPYFEGGPLVPSDANSGRIAKCDVGGCSGGATTLVSMLNNPRGVAVDDAYVYWTDFGSGGPLPLAQWVSRAYTHDGRVMMMVK